MPEIHITTPCVINEITILPIPNNMSKKFRSRSQVMIKGMIGGVSFHGPAEPDGRGGHCPPEKKGAIFVLIFGQLST